MNILVIHETDYCNKVVFEYQIIPEILASRGHSVYVLETPTTWEKKNLRDIFARTIISKNVRKANKKNGITLITPGFIKLPILNRLSVAIVHFFIIKQVILKYKIQVIYLYSAPTNGLQALYWAKKFKIPIYFRLLDVLHELVPYKILVKPAYLIEKYLYPRVQELSAISPKLTKYALRLGAKPVTTNYLATGFDADLFRPRPKNKELKTKFGLMAHDKVIIFAGTLYNFSGLDKILFHYLQNQRKYPRVKFLIVGRGPQEEKITQMISHYHAHKKIIFVGFVDYRRLAHYLNLADIGINPFENNDITRLIFPSKIYQYLACNLAVIATRLPGLMDIFPEGSKNIYYFDDRYPEEFFRLISRIKIRKYDAAQYSLQKIALVIEKRLKRLIENNQA